MRRAWIFAALALACSRENPGFYLNSGGQDGGLGELTSSSSAADSGSGSDATSLTTEVGTSGPTDTTGEPLSACPGWSEPALDLKVHYQGAPLVPGKDCPPARFRGNGALALNTLTLYDDKKCSENLDGEFTLTVGSGVPLIPFASGCFEVEVAWNTGCSELRSVLLWHNFFGKLDLLAAGVIGSALPPPGASDLLNPELIRAEPCACDPGLESCCASADPGASRPGNYTLSFRGGEVVLGPGESADMVQLGDTTYRLQNLRSHVHADCVDAPLHLDWLAVRDG